MIQVLFFLSGATALVYEVVWSKYLSLMFGSTVQAQTVVLAVFMGGLALGNRVIGRRADWLRRPLAGYGLMELGIGLYAFFFEWIYQFADKVFISLGSRCLEQPAALLALKGGLSITLLLGPTVLMGGTLPLLAAWLQRNAADAGRWSARFYSINSLGAVFGSALAGFYLIRSLGMVSTLQMTALANVVIGFTAIGLARRKTHVPEAAAAPKETPAAAANSAVAWTALLVALTGGVSMGLEVLSSRALSLIFGASLQAFAIVLMAFILGIGIGSGLVASPRFQRWRNAGAVLALLLTAAAVIGLLITGIEQWVTAYRHVRSGLAASTMGFRLHQLIAGIFSIVILGVPAALIGAVLPVCIRLEAGAGEDLGNRVGRLLTWNTIGAVGGVLLTGFVLMPLLGLRNSFAVLAGGLCLGAMGLAIRARQRAFLAAATAIVAFLAVTSVAGGEGWRHVLSSGVFRARETEVDPTVLDRRKQHIRILFYKDAADATVSVEEGDGVGAPDDRGLRINGKPDASRRGDLSTQLLVAHLPLLSRPESKDVFVLGLASGISCAAVLNHPVERMVVAENCAPVLRAAEFFTPWNRGVLTNARTRIRVEDARTVLKLSPHKYDVIVSQPSNPWFAGVGSVFSKEYFELAASRLKPGGIMTQWFHIYEMHDGIVNLVLRTFCAVFPYVEIWDAGPGDLVLLGSLEPWESSPDTLRKGFQREAVRAELASLGLGTPEALLARRFASQATAFAVPDPGPIQSDAFPILEYDAPQAFFMGRPASALQAFDERTWQMELGREDGKSVPATLSEDTVRTAFTYGSCNFQLRQLLAEPDRPLFRARTARLAGVPSPAMPCVFRTNNPPAAYSPAVDSASADVKTLLQAEWMLRCGNGDWKEPVRMIADLLRRQTPESFNRNPPWDAGGYAALAARACVAKGAAAQAREIIKLARRLDPEVGELNYLERLLDRPSHSRAAGSPWSASAQ